MKWCVQALIGILAVAPVVTTPHVSLGADGASGPTPYPAKDSEFPGKGPVRKFGWMVDNRNHFWTQREKDQGAVVFIGDSLTGNFKTLGKMFPELKVANRGIGGDVSRGVLFRFQEDVLDLKPKAVVLLVGTNDLTAHGSPIETAANITAIVDMAMQHRADMPIVVCTVPPSDNPKAPMKAGSREKLNELIRTLPEGRDQVSLCDLDKAFSNAEGKQDPSLFAADKLHLAAPGYEKWTETIRPIFTKAGVLKEGASK